MELRSLDLAAMPFAPHALASSLNEARRQLELQQPSGATEDGSHAPMMVGQQDGVSTQSVDTLALGTL